jgi:hypothetical protein
MWLPRTLSLGPEARMALRQIVGIMSDQVMAGDPTPWNIERLIELDLRLGDTHDGFGIGGLGDESADEPLEVTLGIDDAALLLDGMAFTEMASSDLPWVDMVRWTSDFVTSQLRSHWTDAEWMELAAGPR